MDREPRVAIEFGDPKVQKQLPWKYRWNLRKIVKPWELGNKYTAHWILVGLKAELDRRYPWDLILGFGLAVGYISLHKPDPWGRFSRITPQDLFKHQAEAVAFASDELAANVKKGIIHPQPIRTPDEYERLLGEMIDDFSFV